MITVLVFLQGHATMSDQSKSCDRQDAAVEALMAQTLFNCFSVGARLALLRLTKEIKVESE